MDVKNDKFSNDKIENRIINQLYISENFNASIFDINKIYSKLDIDEEKNNEKIYFYNLSNLNNYINKYEFIKENDLILGKIPDYFNEINLYLFNLIYPGNLINHEVGFFYIGLVHYRYIILILFCFIKIGIVIIACVNMKKNINIIISCLAFIFIILWIFNL